MKLFESSWEQIGAFPRDGVVLIPTGAVEQHGPHLPTGTDSILATAVAEAVERSMPEDVLLVPTVWMGASGHHLGFPGTLSQTFGAYHETLHQVVKSLHRHGFWKFFNLNGHGGNTAPNAIAGRELAEQNPNLLVAGLNYFDLFGDDLKAQAKGRVKQIQHACEFETSLMLHVRPDLVDMSKAINDGLQPPPFGGVHMYDVLTERGVKGEATLGDAAFGKLLFDRAVEKIGEALKGLRQGYQLEG